MFCETVPPNACEQGQIIREGYGMITDVLREPVHELHCEADITPTFFVVFDVFPFASGGQRLAFKGSIFERTENNDAKFHVNAVVKMEMAHSESIALSTEERTEKCLAEAERTVQKHEISSKLALEWGQLGINKSVYVLATEKICITRGCGLRDIDRAKFPMLHHLYGKLSLESVLYPKAVGTVEDFLPGKFTKFLNNDGSGNEKVVANFPSAFAHWSWVQSKGTLMISDIQGVRTGSGYILTDPCVHSLRDETGFGMSDLGMIGIEEFFGKHRCNDLCRDLGLGKDSSDLDIGQAVRTRLRQPKKDTDQTETQKQFQKLTTTKAFSIERCNVKSSSYSDRNLDDGKLERIKTCYIPENIAVQTVGTGESSFTKSELPHSPTEDKNDDRTPCETRSDPELRKQNIFSKLHCLLRRRKHPTD